MEINNNSLEFRPRCLMRRKGSEISCVRACVWHGRPNRRYEWYQARRGKKKKRKKWGNKVTEEKVNETGRYQRHSSNANRPKIARDFVRDPFSFSRLIFWFFVNSFVIGRRERNFLKLANPFESIGSDRNFINTKWIIFNNFLQNFNRLFSKIMIFIKYWKRNYTNDSLQL